jgi:hypothetical protein
MYGKVAGGALPLTGIGVAFGWSLIAGITLVSVGLALMVFVPRVSRRRKVAR